MKTIARFGSLVLVLGLAGFFAGCASSHHYVRQPAAQARDFEIVETSTKRTLNPQEMAVLRAKVVDYLEKQGATASGDYYVKVFLGADQEGAPAEWVVVRFTRDSEMRFSLLASYPAYSTSANSYLAYDYYPYGYDSFGRISFQYYDDPYYGSRYYFPPVRRHDHDKDNDHDGHHDRGKDGNHDGDGKHHDDTPRTQDPRIFKPSAPAPQVTHTRWDGDSSNQNNRSRDNNYPHHGGDSVNRSSGGSSASTYTPPVRPSNESAPRADSTRGESFRTSSQSAPSYNSAPARSESTQSSSSNETHREANRSAALRE